MLFNNPPKSTETINIFHVLVASFLAIYTSTYAANTTTYSKTNIFKTVYLHIGSPKTGTSSIQSFASLNHNALLKHNVFYPLSGRELGRIRYKNVFANGFPFYEDNRKNIEKILKNFDESKCTNILISEEMFFGGNLISICNFFASSKYELKIIVYLRHAIEYLASFYSVVFDNSEQKELELFIKSNIQSYLDSLNMLKTLPGIIGKNNVIVKTFEEERWLNGLLIDDFFSIFNVKISEYFQKIKKTNVSFSREKIEKFRYLHKRLYNKADYDKIMAIVPPDKEKQKVIDSLPDKLIKEISEIAYPIECQIAKIFLGRDELFTTRYPKIYGTNGTKRNTYYGLDDNIKEELNFIIKKLEEIEL
ncbi:MAG: hypothetical protein HRT87_07350 [Legionellales bacterium]|nr:hypothetical protein [Legionellales bacterium]